MHASRQFWALLGLASCVLADAVYSNATSCPDLKDTRQDGLYLSPDPSAVYSAKDVIKFTFCSGRYAKVATTSVKWYIRPGTPDQRENEDLHLITSGDSETSRLPFLSPTEDGGYNAGTYTVVIFEEHTNYGTDDGIALTRLPLTIN